MRRFLDEVVAMGYRLLITELDTQDRALAPDIPVRDKAVADYTRAYLDLMFGYPQLRDVMLWGLVDKYSWLQGFQPRPDGVEKRVTPYDSNFQPKPMRQAIADAFTATGVRTG